MTLDAIPRARPLPLATRPADPARRSLPAIRGASLPSPEAGDVLVVPVTGAYGYSMASNYNGVTRPPVVFCENGEARLVVRRETYDDLVARDV